jgi:transcriptional regulator with XRE-family HTH domain
MTKESPNDGDRYVGIRMRIRRTLLGMSQERLGEILGITFRQIQKYEKGANRVGVGRLLDIALALDVPASYFFEGYPKIGSDRPDQNPSPDIQHLMSTREGLALGRAFVRILDPAIQHSFVKMAKSVADKMASPEEREAVSATIRHDSPRKPKQLA